MTLADWLTLLDSRVTRAGREFQLLFPAFGCSCILGLYVRYPEIIKFDKGVKIADTLHSGGSSNPTGSSKNLVLEQIYHAFIEENS